MKTILYSNGAPIACLNLPEKFINNPLMYVPEYNSGIKVMILDPLKNQNQILHGIKNKIPVNQVYIYFTPVAVATERITDFVKFLYVYTSSFNEATCKEFTNILSGKNSDLRYFYDEVVSTINCSIKHLVEAKEL